MIQGLYKWSEKQLYIKFTAKLDSSLLLAELLHSKSITQGNNRIRKWISEGLIHYITKILCYKCELQYNESGHSDYFIVWEKIHQSYDLDILTTIAFSQDIKISMVLLKNIFRYKKDDIMEIQFEKAKSMLNL